VAQARFPAPTAAPSAAQAEVPYPSSFYAWYSVFILFGIYINSFLDRQILGLLAPAIQGEMGLSDAQMGFLGGPAFAIFYIVAGLPIGYLADRMSRRFLIGAGQAVWTIATMGFGIAQTYPQMVLARIGVGTGESTLSPSAYSMIADLFPPKRLGFALSVYGMGIYVGGGLASLVGGYAVAAMGVGTRAGVESATYVLPLVGTLKAWQVVFFVIAIPTLPLTALLLHMREPIRRGVAQRQAAAANSVGFSEFFKYMRANLGTISFHNIGFAFLSFSGYGAAFWNPSLFARIYQWDLAYVGKALGWMGLFMGPAGILFGGWLADKLLQRGYTDARVRVGLISSVIWFPFGLLYPLMPDGNSAFLLLFPATFIAAMSWGVAPAAIQQMMPNQLRGQASAIYLFLISLLGLAAGPYLLGLITDLVFKDPMRVHHSLVATSVVAHIFSTVLLFLCLRRYRESLSYLERWQAGAGK
jgi:MFS family permease